MSLVTGRAALEAVPVVLHLDHGASFELAMQAIRRGFTSVMYDGSEWTYAENLVVTRQVVAAAHAAGVSVEAEIGHVGDVEDSQGSAHGWLTEPADAERFWGEAGPDYLATAFGTAHSLYKETPRLNLARLGEIGRRVPIPLVMHRGSAVPDDQVRGAIACGVAKVNVSKELKEAGAAGLRRFLAEYPGESDPRRMLAPARAAGGAGEDPAVRRRRPGVRRRRLDGSPPGRHSQRQGKRPAVSNLPERGLYHYSSQGSLLPHGD